MTNSNKKARASWTVMIYMAADDEPSADHSIEFRSELNDIGRMIDNLGEKAKVNVLLQVYLDWNTDENSPPNFRARRYRVKTDFESVKEKPEMELSSSVFMGNSETLTDFINWCKKNYPADKYLLLLWGHGTGSGLFSAEIQNDSLQLLKEIRQYTLTDLATERRVTFNQLLLPDSPFFNNPLKEARLSISYKDTRNRVTSDILTITQTSLRFFRNKPKFTMNTRKPSPLNELKRFIVSRSNLDGLIGRELNHSLSKCFRHRKLDLLVIMGCCMQMIEFGYEIRNHCRYYVASEELIFFDGYNYFASLSDLVERPNLTAKELGAKMIRQTPSKQSYTEEEASYLAISCVDLDKNDEIANELNAIAKVLCKDYDSVHPIIRKTRVKCSHFGEGAYRCSFIDVVWFLENLRENLANANLHSNLRKRIRSLISFIKKQYIIETFIGDKKIPKRRQQRSLGGHGVAIYFPQSKLDHLDDDERGKYFTRKEKAFVNTFSKANAWNDLIFEYMEREEGEVRRRTIVIDDDIRLLNLINENIHLRELIADYV